MKVFDKLFKKSLAETSKVDDTNWETLKAVVDKVWENNRPVREQMSNFLDMYKGKIWKEDELKEHDSRAYINLFFSTIQQIAPLLTDSRPIWSVVAHEPYLQNVAAAYSKALKYFWETRDMSMKLLKAVMDAMIMKMGMFKVFFDPEDGFGGNINIDVVDPRSFFIAPGYDDVWKAPWCGIRTKKPLSWVKRNFANVKEIQADATEDDIDNAPKITFGNSYDYELDKYFVTVTEVWIKDDITFEDMLESENASEGKQIRKLKYPYGKYVYFTKDVYLGTEKCDYWHGLPPYVPLYTYAPIHDFVGTGEVDNIEGLVHELNLIFQKMCGHARKYSNSNVLADLATGIDPETIDTTYHEGGNIYKFDSNAAPNAKEPIRVVAEPLLNPISQQIFDMIPRIIEEITGVTEMAKGVLTTKQGRSASEASILIESSYTRIRQKVRNIEWTVKRLCYMWVRMMQQYHTEPRTFYEMKDGEIAYDSVSNSRAYAEDTVRDPVVAKRIQELEAQGKKPSPESLQQQEDYEALIKAFDDPADPVWFDFDIVIETNSTLPMDKQSLANLMTKLFERKAIDEQALLETLQVPKWEEIVKRVREKNEAQKKPPAPLQQGQSMMAQG